MDSIFQTIKALIGPSVEDTSFDTDLIIHINSTFSVLTQLGVGPKEGFRIAGETETWNDYLQDEIKLEMVKTYIYEKVRLIFDPPTSGPLLEALKADIKEFEWRCNVAVDPPITTEGGNTV